MCEIYILVYAETTLLLIGSSIATIFPLLRSMSFRLWGPSDNIGTASNNAMPLRTFGQGTSKRRRNLVEDDETTLTRGDVIGDGSRASLDGIMKTTNVEQTWGPVNIESQSVVRKLGLTQKMV